MNISRNDLYRIILEEYLLGEGLRGHDAAEELLKKILGDKYKPPEERDPARYAKHHGTTEPMEKPHTDTGETIPIDIDIPSDDAPEGEYSGFQDRSGPPLEDQLMDLIQGMPPEEVADLFQAVFEKIPGVELSNPGDEDYPDEETLYSPGAEGRPVAGFQLQELMGLIREVLEEGHYHDMGGEDEMYDALDPHGFNKMSDAQIVDQAWKDGLEEMIVLDGEGDLTNREEVLAAMKDV
jgi:hypothetical protein